MRNQYRDRRGFALPAALLAMVVIGAVITGGFYAASQEFRSSQAGGAASIAFYVADQGIQVVRGTWFKNNFEQIAIDSVGADSGYVTVSAGDTLGRYSVSIRRVDQDVYLIRSTGWPMQLGRDTVAQRTLGQFVRTQVWDMPMNSALYVYGGVKVTGSSFVTGHDPDGGACNPDSQAIVPGIVSNDTSLVSGTVTTDSTASKGIYGNPPIAQDTTLTSNSLLTYGDVTYADLVSEANLTIAGGSTLTGIAPVASGGQCDESVQLNWGEPGTAVPECQSYMPIIHVSGDLHISNGRGQGILLVDGNLTATGNFDFYGIVIVEGSLSTTGTSNHLNGVVMVNSGGVSLSSTASFSSGNSVLQYSSCAAQRALTAHQRSEPLMTRSWFDLTAAGAPTI